MSNRIVKQRKKLSNFGLNISNSADSEFSLNEIRQNSRELGFAIAKLTFVPKPIKRLAVLTQMRLH